MVYAILKNNKIEKTGTLKKLIGHINPAPQLLSEEELKALNVYLAKSFEYSLKAWERFGESTYIYDSDLDIVREVKEIKEIGLDIFKATKSDEIKQTYSEILTEGYYNEELNITIDCGKDNISDFAMGKQLMDINESTGTKVIDFNNTTHNMSYDNYVILVKGLGNYYMKQLYTKNILYDLVNECEDYNSINEIYWRKAVFDDETLEVIEYEYNEGIE